MFREEIRRWSVLFMLIACLGCLVSCSGSSDKGTKSAEKVLSAMLECPNEKLAPMNGQYFALNETIAPDPESVAAEQESEYLRWQAELGDCFNEKDLQHFIGYSNCRLYFHSIAESHSATISVSEVKPEEPDKEVQYFDVKLQVTDANGEAKECATRWKVEYNVDKAELLSNIELVDDGNIMDLVS